MEGNQLPQVNLYKLLQEDLRKEVQNLSLHAITSLHESQTNLQNDITKCIKDSLVRFESEVREQIALAASVGKEVTVSHNKPSTQNGTSTSVFVIPEKLAKPSKSILIIDGPRLKGRKNPRAPSSESQHPPRKVIFAEEKNTVMVFEDDSEDDSDEIMDEKEASETTTGLEGSSVQDIMQGEQGRQQVEASQVVQAAQSARAAVQAASGDVQSLTDGKTDSVASAERPQSPPEPSSPVQTPESGGNSSLNNGRASQSTMNGNNFTHSVDTDGQQSTNSSHFSDEMEFAFDDMMDPEYYRAETSVDDSEIEFTVQPTRSYSVEQEAEAAAPVVGSLPIEITNPALGESWTDVNHRGSIVGQVELDSVGDEEDLARQIDPLHMSFSQRLHSEATTTTTDS